MSRPRLIETEIFLGCQDRDSSRVRNILAVETKTHRDWEIYLLDVETKTSRDWAKDVNTETPSRLLLITAVRCSSSFKSVKPAFNLLIEL